MEHTAVQVRAAATRFGGETREMLDAYAAMLDVTDADAAAAIRTLLDDETRLFPDELDTVIAAYRSKAEAHSLAVSDYKRVCRQLEVNGEIHDAEVKKLLEDNRWFTRRIVGVGYRHLLSRMFGPSTKAEESCLHKYISDTLAELEVERDEARAEVERLTDENKRLRATLLEWNQPHACTSHDEARAEVEQSLEKLACGTGALPEEENADGKENCG